MFSRNLMKSRYARVFTFSIEKKGSLRGISPVAAEKTVTIDSRKLVDQRTQNNLELQHS
jgi:hypothetical protein